jgi:hypothetical protein
MRLNLKAECIADPKTIQKKIQFKLSLKGLKNSNHIFIKMKRKINELENHTIFQSEIQDVDMHNECTFDETQLHYCTICNGDEGSDLIFEVLEYKVGWFKKDLKILDSITLSFTKMKTEKDIKMKDLYLHILKLEEVNK